MSIAVDAVREGPATSHKVGNLQPSFLLRLLDEIDYGLLVVGARWAL